MINKKNAIYLYLLCLYLSTITGLHISVASASNDIPIVREPPGHDAVLDCREIESGSDVETLEWLVWTANSYLQLLSWTPAGGIKLSTAYNANYKGRLDLNTTTFELTVHDVEFVHSTKYQCGGTMKYMGNATTDFQHTVYLDVGDVPSQPPGAPTLEVLSSQSIRVTWQQSLKDNNSPIKKYMLLLKTPEDTWEDAARRSAPGNLNSTIVKDLSPYTYYQVKVIAVNEAGESLPSEPSTEVQTFEAAPDGKPKIENIQNYTTALFVQFQPPVTNRMNGKLKGYIVSYSEEGKETVITRDVDDPTVNYYNFTDLNPFTYYIIKLQAYNSGGQGPAEEIALRTDHGVPSKPRITNIKNRSNTSLQVEWEKPLHTNGILTRYQIFWKHGKITMQRDVPNPGDKALIITYTITDLLPYTEYKIQVLGCTPKGKGERSDIYRGLTDVTGPSAPGNVNLTANGTDAIQIEWTRPKLFTTKIDQYRIRYRIVMSDSYKEMEVTLANPTQSPEIMEEVIPGLRPNVLYQVEVAGVTHSIFSDKYYVGDYSVPEYINLTEVLQRIPYVHHESSVTVGVAAGLACTVVILVVAIIVFMVLRHIMKDRYQFIGDRDPGKESNTLMLPEAYDENEHESIDVDKFPSHVAKNHADGDLYFSQEYEDINTQCQDRADLSSHHSADPDNKFKNRYSNIVAYDHSRVILKTITGKTKTDYINANYVDGYHKPRAYIAAQGPLPTTFGDFWRMAWEMNTAVIVMITNLWERGRRKCDKYWPDEGEHLYGLISVRLLNSYVTAHYTVRVFSLRNVKLSRRKSSHERVVVQYHFTSWPDHGVPDYSLPVLHFIHKSVGANQQNAGPMIIHCSAGVGRTGTYIVIQSMIEQLRDKSTVSVFAFLSHIRNQRNYLVQTEDQYVFIHDALLEYIESGETEVKDTCLTAYLQDLHAEKQGFTLLSKQYKLVTSCQPKDYQLSSAVLPVNLEKNRSKQILPVELSRVRLPAKPGVEGSDYINGSYLQGYAKIKEYIVTQHPLKTTVEDFWRMVWDQNSMTIVLLSKTSDDGYVEFWPKEEAMDCGHFKVTFSEETENGGITMKDFILMSKQDDYECITRLYQVTDWPESCTPITNTLDLVRTVQTWHHQHEDVEGPITVVDRFGGKEAATFCALSTMFEQLQQEGSVDVYMLAKLYHLKRPGVFPTEEDYHFLYKVAEALCDDNRFPVGDRDSGIGNCTSTAATMPSQLRRSVSRGSTRQETTM